MIKLKIRKGDQVIVTVGKNRGKKGVVLSVFPKVNKAVVAGVNLVKKHTKPSRESDGGIITKELPIQISNIALIDPKSGKATKVGYRVLEDGKKVRFAKISGDLIDKEGRK